MSIDNYLLFQKYAAETDEIKKMAIKFEIAMKYTALFRRPQIYYKKLNILPSAAREKISGHIGYDKDDISTYAFFGILDAIEKFDCEKNIEFGVYARWRILGSIIDHIRFEGWFSRSDMDKYKKYNYFVEDFSSIHHRYPTNLELEENFGKNFMVKMHTILMPPLRSNGQNRQMLLEDSIDGDYSDGYDVFSHNDYFHHLNGHEKIENNVVMNDFLDEIYKVLKPRELLIFSLIYLDDYIFVDVAELFNMTQASISLVNAKIDVIIKELMSGYQLKGN